MSQPYSETLVAPSPTVEEALADIRTLWHYLPDYDYRPDLFDYAEFYTSDPGYVVVGVSMMSAGAPHGDNLNHTEECPGHTHAVPYAPRPCQRGR